jgi:peptidoglycan hydrolase-like protein with peptidoglycan-binding domain
MNKIAITAIAAAMGLAWSVLPAIGADPNDQSVKDKAANAWDKTKEKTSEAWDKTKEKTSEAWDKTKEKATEAKDKIKEKTASAKDTARAKMGPSDDIRLAQQALRDKGHDPGPIDGVMGPRTASALREYQKVENIKVTGRLDSQTKSHLIGSQASSTTSTTPSASPASPSTVGSPSGTPYTPEKK